MLNNLESRHCKGLVFPANKHKLIEIWHDIKKCLRNWDMRLNKHTSNGSLFHKHPSHAALYFRGQVFRLSLQARETRLGVPACSVFSIRTEGYQDARVSELTPRIPVAVQVSTALSMLMMLDEDLTH